MTPPRHAPISPRIDERFALALLLAIVAVGLGLRIWYLRQPYVDMFSWRQASTAMIAENYFRTNPNILFPEVNWSGPGPNYQGREFQTVTYLASLLYRIFGQEDWIGRAVAAAFGTWGIVALFLLVRRVSSGTHALAAAAALAIMPGSVFIDRSFLPDPAMVALATTTLWLFVAWLQSGGRRLFLATGVVGGVAFATKLPGLIVGLPMAYATFATLGVRESLRPRRALQLIALAAMILAPVIGWYLWARHVALSYPPYHFAGEGNWVWDAGLQRWLDQRYFLPKAWMHFSGWLWTPSFAALVVLGFIVTPWAVRSLADERMAADRSQPVARGTLPLLFHVWLAAAVLFYLIGARELVDNPWNFHVASPAAAGLAGGAIAWTARLAARAIPRRGMLAALAVSAGIVGVVLYVSRRNSSHAYIGYAAQGREMGLALQRLTPPGTLILTMASALGDPTPIYYARRRGWVFPPARDGKSWGTLPADDAESIALLDELRASGARWLGITAEQLRELRAHPALLAHIGRVSGAPIEEPSFVLYPLTPITVGDR